MSFPEAETWADFGSLLGLLAEVYETRMPECQNAGILEYWNAGMPEYWNAGMPECWNTGVWSTGVWSLESGVLKFHLTYAAKFDQAKRGISPLHLFLDLRPSLTFDTDRIF